MKKIILVVVLLASAFQLYSQIADSCRLKIGTNLSGPADWGSEWPFVNIMKYCRTWITFNNQWVNGGENAWDTGFQSYLELDEHGYPLELPFDAPGAEAPQVVRTVWANTEALKGGIYTVLFDGEGTLGFQGDAEVRSMALGRYEIEVFPGRDDIFMLEIRESVRGNHVRNIRVLMPGTEATYENNPWSEEWMEKLEPFGALRFMDWGYTNGSTLKHWDERPEIDDYTYTINGIPYEWMIELCNTKQADAWICVPHESDDNFIREMAALFRDNLDPSLNIYVEYSNEIWNWIFDQTHYCFENGDTTVPWPERIVPFVQNALDIWTDEFTGQTERLIRVVAVQHSWQDVSNRVVFNMRQGSFDAFSPAAYFGFPEDGIAELEALGADATADDVIRLARQGIRGRFAEWTRSQYNSIATTLDIPMLYYEGGQHLTPEPFGTVQPYNQALVDVQTHPEMYDLYVEWYDTLKAFAEDEASLLMNFSFISPKSGQYGTWGVLESQFYQEAPYDDAPKYQAILDNLADCEEVTGTSSIAVDIAIDLYPNPASAEITISAEEPILKIQIADVSGKIISKWYPGRNHFTTSVSHFPKGIYFVKITTSRGLNIRRLVKVD